MKQENETTLREKLIYVLKFSLATIGTTFVLSILFFIFSNFTSYFTPPLLPLFDPERLGQLGDYLGGTLNPLIGIITITLLAISILIQRRELKDTSDALRRQNDLMVKEQTRSELIPIMEQYHEKLSKNSKFKFNLEITPPDSELISMFIGEFKSLALEDIYQIAMRTEGFSEEMHRLFINHDPRKYNFFSPIWKQLHEAKSLMEEMDRLMTDYISIAQLKSVERFWFSKYQNALYFCSSIGAISDADRDDYIAKIQPIRQKFIFSDK